MHAIPCTDLWHCIRVHFYIYVYGRNCFSECIQFQNFFIARECALFVALFAASMCVSCFSGVCADGGGRQGSRQSCHFTCFSQLWGFHDAVFECVPLILYRGLLYATFATLAPAWYIFSSQYLRKLARWYTFWCKWNVMAATFNTHE